MNGVSGPYLSYSLQVTMPDYSNSFRIIMLDQSFPFYCWLYDGLS